MGCPVLCRCKSTQIGQARSAFKLKPASDFFCSAANLNITNSKWRYIPEAKMPGTCFEWPLLSRPFPIGSAAHLSLRIGGRNVGAGAFPTPASLGWGRHRNELVRKFLVKPPTNFRQLVNYHPWRERETPPTGFRDRFSCFSGQQPGSPSAVRSPTDEGTLHHHDREPPLTSAAYLTQCQDRRSRAQSPPGAIQSRRPWSSGMNGAHT